MFSNYLHIRLAAEMATLRDSTGANLGTEYAASDRRILRWTSGVTILPTLP
jgi:hypothetical protein